MNDNSQPTAEATVEAVAAETPVDIQPSLEEALRLAEQAAAEHHDAWLRAKADAENIRRRAAEDVLKASKFGAEKFATAMLPVKDSLEAALATENTTLDSLKSGVELTLKQLQAAFQGAGLTEIAPLGEKFDPNRHQAIGQQDAEGEPNRVLTVLQKGYALHERVVRPALVITSKAKAGA